MQKYIIKKKILVFRSDRVGDLINTSSFLKSLKVNYENSEITLICSLYNSVVAKDYKFIDKIIIYDKSFNLIKKLFFIFKFFLSNYDISVALDGKNISYFISIIANAKHKYAICFKKNKKIFGFNYYLYRPYLFICKFFFHTYVICSENYSDPLANKDFKNHYLTLFFYLFKKNNVNLIPHKHIYYLNSDSIVKYTTFFNNHINSKYLILHIDAKWDSYAININEFNTLLNKISSNLKVIITTGIEESVFIQELKSLYKKYYFKNDIIHKSNETTNNIFILDNISLNLLGAFIKNSVLFISSHSGAPFHISASFNVPIIDFIKKEKELEYDRWIPLNIKYFRVSTENLHDLEKLVFNLT